MRRRYFVLTLTLIAVLVGFLAACESSVQSSQNGCEQADEKLTEGSYEEARREYNALIRPPMSNPEQTVVQEPTTNGEQTLEQEQTDAREGTTGDGQDATDCAEVGLQLVAIFTLADLGLHDEAREKLTTFITEHPETPVPEDLKYLFGGRLEGWNWVKAEAGPELLPVAEILATIAIVLLVYVALRRRVWPWVRNLFLRVPFLDIQDFDSEVESLKGGKGFAMMVEEQIRRIDAPDSGLRPGIVAAPAAPLEVPASLLPSPYLKILSQLIGWIVPQRIVTLSGYLLAPGDRGAGLTLTLTESWTGEIIGSQTIWEEEYGTALPIADPPNPEPHYSLAEWAAIWTWYEVNGRYNQPAEESDDQQE